MDDAATLNELLETLRATRARLAKHGRTSRSAGDRSETLMSLREVSAEIESIERKLRDLDRPLGTTTSYVRIRRAR